MIKTFYKHCVFFILIAFFSVACGEKNSSNYKTNDQAFWLKPYPKMTPYDVINILKENKAHLNCPTDYPIGFSSKTSNLVRIDKYIWMDKEFSVNFYFWNEKLTSVLLSSIKEAPYEESLKIAEKFVSLFINLKGSKPKVKNRFDSGTKHISYSWEDNGQTITIVISSIVSDTAIFNISFTNKKFSPSSQEKYQEKYEYLEKCRGSKKKTPQENNNSNFSVPAPPKPPVRH